MPNKVNTYNREKAVEYAHNWAYKRNPAYYNFDGLGGDCTNFASQVLFSGGKSMNYKPIYGWYYHDINQRTPSWSGVEFLYNFITANKGGSTFGAQCDVKDILNGDLIQLSFSGDVFQHTLIVVECSNIANINDIKVATHTFDADYRPLTSYNWADIRFLHIL